MSRTPRCRALFESRRASDHDRTRGLLFKSPARRCGRCARDDDSFPQAAVSILEPKPVTLEGHGVRLEPLKASHEPELARVVSDGRLWELWFTFVPEPDALGAYIAAVLEGTNAGEMVGRGP